MMRIRCPNCDSTHEVPASVLSGKPRKVRCASCRTVFEAKADSDSPMPTGGLVAEAAAAAAATAGAANLDWPDTGDALIGDNMVSPVEAEADMGADFGADMGADMNAAMGQDDLDALFADAPAETMAEPLGAETSMDAPTAMAGDDSLAGPDAAMLAAGAAAAAAGVAATAATADEEPRPRKRIPHAKPARSNLRFMPALGMVAATGIGTLVALAIFRHETVRIAPGLAPYFEMMGLEVNSTGLEIHGVRSHVVMEDHREMLEISGQIVNITRARQAVPVIRLSLHNAEGQQLYVWTGSADSAELGAGEKTLFRRRLASPPRDATQVMVRFVARDDIVAAIR